jgi:hypothetical protein
MGSRYHNSVVDEIPEFESSESPIRGAYDENVVSEIDREELRISETILD